MAEEEYEEQPQADEEYEEQPDAEPEAQPEPEAEPEPEPEPEAEAEPEQKEYAQADMPNSIGDACQDLYSDNASFNWFTTKLKDPVKIKTAELVLDKVGTGGLTELKQVLANEKGHIIFFLLRVNTYDNEQSVRAKFVYGRFVGTGVKFMAKAKLTPNLGAIADQFPVKHLSKDCDEEMKDWNPEKLSKEFLRIGGAHKPSKYEYGPDAVFNV
mmetsp:Transcript_266/g.379  ORF Transcript_266/g.379 Transcript_266/m.379 type:complete len:213 (+) Transcript_266:144-782(+)|eukprot:CAMPEP_0197038318 /NCGR_PEP_ID=MMETSP1384-20130603/15272_1 /TAXON_ID=29189 /ORGANISM="Ammonia sp." /LENGTH=212 /DNA_ID=CAMNT_0042468731 /DNA_START=52 /DNA_END=690 /DNA_ORIENTATION=+